MSPDPAPQTTDPVTAAEIATERNPTRKAILSAIAAVLAGTVEDPALRGRVSIDAVASAANVKVHHLKSGSHKALKDRFLALKAQQETTQTPAEARLNDRNEKLSEQLLTITRRYDLARAERDQLRQAMDALAHQLQATILEKLEIERNYRDTMDQEGNARVVMIRTTLASSDPAR